MPRRYYCVRKVFEYSKKNASDELLSMSMLLLASAFHASLTEKRVVDGDSVLLNTMKKLTNKLKTITFLIHKPKQFTLR